MTTDELLTEAFRRCDEMWFVARSDAYVQMRAVGASEEEIDAMQGQFDAMWRTERAKQLREARQELEDWIESGHD